VPLGGYVGSKMNDGSHWHSLMKDGNETLVRAKAETVVTVELADK
jgi:hypothetical protein